ncbi:hypothetical protein H310_11220 [Aphanomyces invadans]|uniref:TRP C-terminal domain-containing protein n=1 Tax=Aphanomyces invadans TaxID=157072 RepID=A0A024TMR7_9STRA|nr:hypothetical protein H310_11220 [Aphanomyces invadans]ETV95323.1 hypothetical protein H310_11220 [Aphanomyces invadans]|eukprot:XP_008876024.1 hypothetical protein H310_11220 [Aphanomyces invadans]
MTPVVTTTSAPVPTDVTVEPTATPTTTTTDVTTKAPTTIPVTTDLPVVTAKTEEPLSNSTLLILNGTNAPVTTVSSDNIFDKTPSPTNEGGAPSGNNLVTDAPIPSRPSSAPRTTPVPGAAPTVADVDPSQATVAGSDTSGNKTNRYVFNAVVGLTLVFLAFFHYLAIDPSFLAPESATGAFTAPNSWELPSFASFMQFVAVVSCASVEAPHAIFASFTDSFSWLNFIVRGSANSGKPSAVVASSLLTDLTSSHRALEATGSVYDAFGFYQFSLRMIVLENDLFLRAWTFFFIVLVCLLVLVIATAAVSQFTGRRTPFTQSDSGSYTSTLRDASRRLQGITVWFVTMAVLPLSTVSMYELMRDITSAIGFGSISGVFALISLVVIGVGILAAGYMILRHTEVQLSKYRTKITFGVLYTNFKFEFRAFFAAALLLQYATGVLLAGVVAPSTQLILLMALHAAYIVLVVVLRPFVSTLQLVFTIVFEVVVVAVFGLSYAMSKATTIDSKLTLAYVVVILVCVVIVAMFIRSLIKLWTFVVGAGSHDLSTRTNGVIPPLQSAELNSNRGADTISLNSGSLGSDDYATLATPTKTVKLVDTNAKQV